MIALVTNVEDEPVAIHRTFLRPNGQGKAFVEPDKMTLGPIAGCAIRLAPAAEAIAVGEGIETVLSVMSTTERPAWSALSAPGLKSLNLPTQIRRVTILADRDPISRAGEDAARYAAHRWRVESPGRRVWIKLPQPGCKDFNDELTGRRDE